ncbi:hypothetical protein BJ742DRAFT_687080, partial [Cladochytrium replicatum]
IVFESRKLCGVKVNYLGYDIELLALRHCLNAFRPYLKGHPVILKTDQKPLLYLLDSKLDKMNNGHAKVLDVILVFDLLSEWIPGKKLTSIAGILSHNSKDISVGVQPKTIWRMNQK